MKTTPQASLSPKTTIAEAIQKTTSAYSGAASLTTTSKNLNRIKSFMIDPELEKRFRKARLQSGFEKLEDAYNEALKKFCELSEKGMIDNS